MPTGKMHADEVDTDISLVGRLVAAQFPRWADLPIEPVRSAGTDNAIYRLGNDMGVRLPRIQRATGNWTRNASGCREAMTPERPASERWLEPTANISATAAASTAPLRTRFKLRRA